MVALLLAAAKQAMTVARRRLLGCPVVHSLEGRRGRTDADGVHRILDPSSGHCQPNQRPPPRASHMPASSRAHPSPDAARERCWPLARPLLMFTAF